MTKSHRRDRGHSSSSDSCHKCKRRNCCCDSSSSSSSTPECDNSNCKKVCFGHWGAPKCRPCKKYAQYDECDFDKIPTGSLVFIWDMSLIGAVKSLASKQCYNQIGIIVQVKQTHSVDSSSTTANCRPRKCFTREPYVYTIEYNGSVGFQSLHKLARSKTVRRIAVRPLKPTCNECTDIKRSKNLLCIMKEYQDQGYEPDGACVMRNIFNLDIINPNFDGFTDTKLVYSVLFRNALLKDNGCCDLETPSCSTEYTSGRSESLTCESHPCEDDRCCDSSSYCEKCELRAYDASKASLADFLYDGADGCLDLRWFSALVPVWTECGTKGHDAAIDEKFCQQTSRFIKDMRKLVSCWSAGQALPCLKQCRDPCGNVSSSTADACNPACKVGPCEIDGVIANLDILYSYLSGINYANLPNPLPTTLDGNYITSLFNEVLKSLCQKCDRYLVTSTYTYPTTGGLTINYAAGLTAPVGAPGGLDGLSNDLVSKLIATYGITTVG